MRALLTARDRSAPIDALYKCLLRSRAATLRAVERMDAAVLVVATACGAADGGGAAATAETRQGDGDPRLAEEGDGGRAALARDPRAVPALVELCGGGGLVTSKCKEQAARALRALAREPAHLRAVGRPQRVRRARRRRRRRRAVGARGAVRGDRADETRASRAIAPRAIAAAGGLGALITLLRAGSAEAKLVAATALGLLAEQLGGGGGGGGAGGLHAAQVAELRQLMSQLARSGEPDAKAVARVPALAARRRAAAGRCARRLVVVVLVEAGCLPT